jgi:hypothetical protein
MVRCLALLMVVLALFPGALKAEPPSLLAHRGDLRLERPGGAALAGIDLVGAELELDAGGIVQIAAAAPDPRDRQREIMLFDLRIAGPGGAWRPLCAADADGLRVAIPGIDPTMPLGFGCTGGPIAKCARMGYAPWRVAPDGRPMAEYHAACVLLMRGEYAGDGIPHTRNGTLVDLWDRAGIMAADGDEGLEFEAGWSASGAVCVAHARVPEVTDLAALAARYPWLAAPCTEAIAEAAGALLFNRSARR